MSSQVDEIKSKLDIVDVLSEYIQLKSAGTNFKALCPFHSEKTPSFMASRERQIWHCFGCGEGGDVFSFVQKIESLDFPEALKILANKAGVKLLSYDHKIAGLKDTLLKILELTSKFWRKILLESPQGVSAREYLAGRGVMDDAGDEFFLGCAPQSWDATLQFLRNKEFSENDIFLSGLLIKKEHGHGFYDRFRGRLMFPIRDHQGSVVGFGGRILPGQEDKNSAKYINTPQTQVYNKSTVVYNLDLARAEIKKHDLAVLVEGYMDVVASWQAGVKNVVATSGTALTVQQIKLLSRFTKNFAFAFDSDQAGQTASFRGVDMILATDVNLKVITLPFGKDPDEVVRRDAPAWVRAVSSAQPFMEYLYDTTLRRFSVTSVDGKKNIGKILLPYITKMGNAIEQAHWVHKLSSVLNTPAEMLFSSIRRTKTPEAARNEITHASGNVAAKKTRRHNLEELLLSLGLKYPEFLPFIIDRCGPEIIQTPDLQSLYKSLIIFYTKYADTHSGIPFDYHFFLDFLASEQSTDAPRIRHEAETLLLLAEKDFFDYTSPRLKQELENILSALRFYHLQDRLQVIKLDLERAEKNSDSQKIQLLSEEFSQIMSELNLLNSY